MAMRSSLPLLVLLLGLVCDVGSHGSSMEGDSSSRYLKHPTGYANIDEELARLNYKIIEGTRAERNLPLEFGLLLEANV